MGVGALWPRAARGGGARRAASPAASPMRTAKEPSIGRRGPASEGGGFGAQAAAISAHLACDIARAQPGSGGTARARGSGRGHRDRRRGGRAGVGHAGCWPWINLRGGEVDPAKSCLVPACPGGTGPGLAVSGAATGAPFGACRMWGGQAYVGKAACAPVAAVAQDDAGWMGPQHPSAAAERRPRRRGPLVSSDPEQRGWRYRAACGPAEAQRRANPRGWHDRCRPRGRGLPAARAAAVSGAFAARPRDGAHTAADRGGACLQRGRSLGPGGGSRQRRLPIASDCVQPRRPAAAG
jgi:hypothetical protein